MNERELAHERDRELAHERDRELAHERGPRHGLETQPRETHLQYKHNRVRLISNPYSTDSHQTLMLTEKTHGGNQQARTYLRMHPEMQVMAPMAAACVAVLLLASCLMRTATATPPPASTPASPSNAGRSIFSRSRRSSNQMKGEKGI
jgi:hypothetical protein